MKPSDIAWSLIQKILKHHVNCNPFYTSRYFTGFASRPKAKHFPLAGCVTKYTLLFLVKKRSRQSKNSILSYHFSFWILFNRMWKFPMLEYYVQKWRWLSFWLRSVVPRDDKWESLLIFVIKKIANLKNRFFHPSSYCSSALLRH